MTVTAFVPCVTETGSIHKLALTRAKVRTGSIREGGEGANARDSITQYLLIAGTVKCPRHEVGRGHEEGETK